MQNQATTTAKPGASSLLRTGEQDAPFIYTLILVAIAGIGGVVRSKLRQR